MTTQDQYWVNLTPDERVSHLMGMRPANLELYNQLYKNISSYYSNLYNYFDVNSSLNFTGSQGELVSMKVNQSRSLVRQLVSIVCKGRMAFQAHARNTDGDSLTTSRLVTNLVQQVINDQEIEQLRETMLEHDLVTGMSFARVGWCFYEGEEFVNDKASLAQRGDLEVEEYTMFDVMFDLSKTRFEDSEWVVVKLKRNRWNLMAQYADDKELTERIKSAPSYYQDENYNRVITDSGTYQMNDDTVCVYQFTHKSTRAVPDGRYMEFLSDDCILVDDINPWKEKLNVVCLRTQPIMNSPYGYALFNDLLPLQEMLDHNFSVVASNQSAFGVQSILNPRGSNISVEDIKGRSFINYTPANATGGGKPEALQLTQTAPEIFKFADTLRSHLMELSNINGALRGDPPPGVTSGTAIATLTTNAVEFVTTMARAVDRATEEVLNLCVTTYKVFGGDSQVIRMVGKANQWVVKEFKSDDLMPFERVILRPVNPLTVSAAGRMQLAEQLNQNHFIKTPQQMLEVLTTGNLEVLYQDDVSELDLIVKNNEELLDGKMPIILATDNHPLAMYRALALLHDPEVRRSSKVVGNILQYVQQHEDLMKNTDPVLQSIAATGQVPPPQPAPAGPPPQGPPPGAPQ